MRFVFLVAILMLVAIVGPAAATTPDAQAAYAERRGLMELDRRCNLFAPDVRGALNASADQARGALLRGGWSSLQVFQLEQAALGAARERACDDPRTTEAATRARTGFASWARTNNMNFPGAYATWRATRYPDAAGWKLKQDITAPRASFGVRDANGAERLSFIAPLANAPAAAQLMIRDARHAQFNGAIPGRTATGLEAGLPFPANARYFMASERETQTIAGARVTVFSFPVEAFQRLIALDPRETVEVRLGADGQGGRYLIEVGDIAAARAFLALQPQR